MAGNIRHMIDAIIEKRARGNPTVAITTKTKFILRGLNPDNFNATSPDDPAILEKVKSIATEMGVSV